MDMTQIKATIRGPMIPVITHLTEGGAIDHDAVRTNVQYVIDRGIKKGSGVLLAGGAGGDFPMLTLEERQAVCKTILEVAEGETPVLVSAQGTDSRTIIAMAKFAEESGAFGIQVSPGYYYASSDDDCLRLFEAVHEATERIVLMIYNTHWEGYDMSLEQIGRLAKLPRCRALKWSKPVAGRPYLDGLHRYADRLAIVDNQGLHVMNHMLGGTGYITHLATVWPEHDLRVWQLLEEGAYPAAQELLCSVNWPWSDFRQWMWDRTGAESPVIKAALELCGRPGGPSPLPTRELTAEERQQLAGVLDQIGVPRE